MANCTRSGLVRNKRRRIGRIIRLWPSDRALELKAIDPSDEEEMGGEKVESANGLVGMSIVSRVSNLRPSDSQGTAATMAQVGAL